MRAKLLAPFPDKVNSKLAVLDKNKPVTNPLDKIKALQNAKSPDIEKPQLIKSDPPLPKDPAPA